MVEPSHAGLYFKDGKFVAILDPGVHAFWKGAGQNPAPTAIWHHALILQG
ncbi:MAG: hypothetical protein KJ645_10355 [Planctomycetes bacterium]|nr:hypothetical protein [Planctomycetota bacterium]